MSSPACVMRTVTRRLGTNPLPVIETWPREALITGPSSHPGQPPKSLPEHRSICYQGPNLSNGVFQAPLLAPASHQVLPTDPSSPTQNRSR